MDLKVEYLKKDWGYYLVAGVIMLAYVIWEIIVKSPIFLVIISGILTLLVFYYPIRYWKKGKQESVFLKGVIKFEEINKNKEEDYEDKNISLREESSGEIKVEQPDNKG